MKRLLLLLLFPTLALAQTVPNGGITQGQVWSVPQWTTAWQSKADTASPAFTGTATIGGVAIPTVASPAFTGTPTVNGTLVPSFPQTAAEAAALVTPSNYNYRAGNVLRYGADPTNTNDSTTAFTNAIAAFPNGGTVIVPPGTYKVSSLTLTTGVVVQGSGITGSTILSTSTTATLLTLQAGASVTDMQLGASVTKSAGSLVSVQGNGVLVRRVQFTGYYVGITVGVLGGFQPKNTQIRHCIFFNPVVASGTGGISAVNVSNIVIDGIVMSGPLSGTQPDFGIRMQNGDTAVISNTNITLHGKALQMDTPVANNFYAASFVNDLFDSAGTNSSGAVSSAVLQPAGGIYNTKFANVWFGLSVSKFGLELAPTGAGAIDGLSCIGCEFPHNGDSGLILNGTGVKNIVVTGGGSGGNANYGYRITGGASYFTITGVSAGTYSNRGANNYGIVVDAGASDNYLIADNNVRGNTSAGIFDSGAGTNAQVYQNNGYNGLANAAGVTVTASPFSYTAGHTPEEIYIFGGTVSNITIDGAQIANATGIHVRLVPNETTVITYTVAPTVIKKTS